MSHSVLCVSGRGSSTGVAKVLLSMIGILLLSTTLYAQVNQGRILGDVRDQSGGAIAGATVTVTDTLKGVSRTLTTDEAGEYAAPNLDPSTYSIRVEYKGFKTYTREGMQIGVGQEAKVDVVMQPGEQAQTVTVTEAIPLVETTSATLTGNITTQTIAELPLNGRNFVNLLSLRPGYVNLPGGGGGNQAGMGLRPGDNMLLVDGLNVYEWGQGQQIVNGYGPAGDAQTLIPIDAIQEFNIQQNPKAEFGWKPGVQVNLGVKSGTNSIHGTAYAFGRDGSWDALNDYQPTNLPAPPLSFEQYGATAGGPIKKDKLFWYTAFEAQTFSLGITTPINAPVDVAGGGVTNSMVDACNALNPGHLPYSIGNPANPITPLSATLAGLSQNCTVTPANSSPTGENVFPTNLGNQFPGAPKSVVPTGLLTLADINSTYNGLAKVDYHPNEKSTLSGMFWIGQASGTWDDNPSVIVSNWWTSYLPVHDRVGSGSWTWVPNSSWVNEFKVGFTHQYSPFFANDHNANPNAPWGISGGVPTGYAMNTGVTNKDFFGFPRININGFTQLGGNWPKFVGPSDNVEFLDHISYLKGKHAFKFGGELTFVQVNTGATSNAKGRVNFKKGGGLTALENFLEGNPVTTGLLSSIFVGDPLRDVRSTHYALFFQDDYRMTTRVTVNLGLRWELATVPNEAHGLIANFDPNSPTGMVQVGNGLASPFVGQHHNFSPRIGFAWDVSGNQKTVVRAGASMLYEYVPFSALFNSGGNAIGLGKDPTGADICVNGTCVAGSGSIAAATINPDPASVRFGWQNNGPNTPIFQGSVVCGDGNPVANPGTTGLKVGQATAPCPIASFDPNVRTPYAVTWNLDIQRAITPNLSLAVAYLGNHGVDFYGTRDVNTPATGAGYSAAGLTACATNPATCTNLPDQAELGPYSSKFPYLSYILGLSNLYRSHYNAAQVTLTQRTSHGLSFTAAYTYSHALDDVSQNFGATTPLHNENPGLNYGNSDYDIRHRFTFEANYAIPGKKTPGQILEGWEINSIVTLQSGQPWAVQDLTNDFSGTGEVGNPNSWGEAWNFFGNPKDFTAVPNTAGIPFFGPCPASGCTSDPSFGINNPACTAHSGAPGTLGYASLVNNGCYVSGTSVLLPPAYGTFGTVGKNIFHDTPFRTWDMSVTKTWKFKERLTAQFRAEFFNVLNHPLFGDVGSGHLASNDPSVGVGFGAASATPDQASGNPVLGSGSNRDIQLGLKLIF